MHLQLLSGHMEPVNTLSFSPLPYSQGQDPSQIHLLRTSQDHNALFPRLGSDCADIKLAYLAELKSAL